MTDAKPTMKPHRIPGFSEWCVAVEWPNGKVQHVNGFDSEVQANGWIRTEGPAWVAKAEQAPKWT